MGNYLSPISLEPKMPQSFYTDGWEFEALIKVNSLTMMGHSSNMKQPIGIHYIQVNISQWVVLTKI